MNIINGKYISCQYPVLSTLGNILPTMFFFLNIYRGFLIVNKLINKIKRHYHNKYD